MPPLGHDVRRYHSLNCEAAEDTKDDPRDQWEVPGRHVYARDDCLQAGAEAAKRNLSHIWRPRLQRAILARPENKSPEVRR